MRSNVVQAAELAALIQPVWIAALVIALARSGWELRWARAALLAGVVTTVSLLPVPASWPAGRCNSGYGIVALVEVPHMLAGLPHRPIAAYGGYETLVACV